MQKKLYQYYSNKVFRIYKWKNWKDRRRSEDKFIDRIGKVFGQDIILAYGAGAGWHAIKGMASTPTTGLRRRIAQKYSTVTIDEFRTTITCSRCRGKVEKDYSRRITHIEDKKEVPLRSIRCCYNALCGGFRRWNRDYNAAINIRANLLHWIQHGQWDPSFTRKTLE